MSEAGMPHPPTYDGAMKVAAVLAHPTIDEIMPFVLPHVRFCDLHRCARVQQSWYLPCMRLIWSDPTIHITNTALPRSVICRYIDRIMSTETLKPSITTLNWNEWDRFLKGPEFNRDRQISQPRNVFHLNAVVGRYRFYPNVQFEILDEIDGHCDPETYEESRRYSVDSPHSLLLMSMAKCHNLNSSSLLQCFDMESLLFLDISYTLADELLCRRFQELQLPNLRVLKLKGLRLTDWMVKIMLKWHNLLWSLDLCDNLLTDNITEFLLEFLKPRTHQRYHSLDKDQALDMYEYPPTYRRHEASAVEESHPPLRRPDSKLPFTKYVRENGEISPPGQYVLSKDDPLLLETGLTHLYLAGNKLSSSGIKDILSYTDMLQVFDVGSVRCAEHRLALPSGLISFSLTEVRYYISRDVGINLTELRIHHSVVTLAPTFNSVHKAAYEPELLKLTECIGQTLSKSNLHEPFTVVSNFGIRTLSLTGVPRKSYGFIINELKTLLMRYRLQEKILSQAHHDLGYHRRAPPLLTGLQVLRLEFSGPNVTQLQSNSISGDVDAANFNDVSSKDFSFFSNPFASSNKDKAKRNQKPSDFSFFSEEQATASSSSGSSSGINSPEEGSVDKSATAGFSLSRFAASMKSKTPGRRQSLWQPPIPVFKQLELNALAAIFLDLVDIVTPRSASAPAFTPNSSQIAPYFRSESNPVQPEEASGVPIMYDVINEIKKFRMECSADEKWGGKLELVYES